MDLLLIVPEGRIRTTGLKMYEKRCRVDDRRNFMQVMNLEEDKENVTNNQNKN